jgi:Lactate dehydrogenase and related dehydrogenases
MKPKVVVTRKIPDQAIELLAAHCELDVWEEEDVPIPRDVLEEKIRDADGLYCLLTDTVDEPLLDRAPRLRVISNMAVGYNNIDVEAASRRNIMVTNTPDVLTETTADLTFALLMATARRIVEAERFLRAGEWRTWSPMLLTGQDIYGATMGIVGLGRIGSAVARRALGFNMRVLYHSTRRNEQAERELGVQYAGLDELLAQSDFVVIMTPLTPKTQNLIRRAGAGLDEADRGAGQHGAGRHRGRAGAVRSAEGRNDLGGGAGCVRAGTGRARPSAAVASQCDGPAPYRQRLNPNPDPHGRARRGESAGRAGGAGAEVSGEPGGCGGGVMTIAFEHHLGL